MTGRPLDMAEFKVCAQEEVDAWEEAVETDNARILAGYLCGGIGDAYDLASLDPPILKNRRTGNLYRLTVEQISGRR